MEIVIYFILGAFSGALISLISSRLGSSTYEKAVKLIMTPDPAAWSTKTTSQDIQESEGLYDFQNAEDILNQYEGVEMDDPDDDDNREPDLDEFQELK